MAAPCRSYGEERVLSGIDLTVSVGRNGVALLGPNGAGQDHDGADPVDDDSRRKYRRSAMVLGHDLAAEPDAVRVTG